MSDGILTNLAMLWYLIQVVSKNILPSIQTRKRPRYSLFSTVGNRLFRFKLSGAKERIKFCEFGPLNLSAASKQEIWQVLPHLTQISNSAILNFFEIKKRLKSKSLNGSVYTAQFSVFPVHWTHSIVLWVSLYFILSWNNIKTKPV